MLPLTESKSAVWLGRNRTLKTVIARTSLGSPGTSSSYFNTMVSMTCSSNSVSTYHTIGYSIMLCQGVNIVLVVLAGDGVYGCLVY